MHEKTDHDTIAAIATGTGGAVAMLRISGSEALTLAGKVWYAPGIQLGSAPFRTLHFGKCRTSDGETPGEPALAVFMPGPKSYTGEDVVEIHCHGGSLVSRRILEMLISAGARHANPGEFTLRAFLAGKMDLTQAEAVADIINAQSDMALHLAQRQNAGVLGRQIREIRRQFVDILAEVESRLDFPEEELNWQSPENIRQQIERMNCEIRKLIESQTEGEVLREGVRIVLAGAPNAGKSSLLNRILKYDRAIVTELPGTTRDTIEVETVIRGIPARLIDTAGIRVADDLIEGKGVERSIASLRQAQLILWLMDAQNEPDAEISLMEQHLPTDCRAISIWNKCDLTANPEKLPASSHPTVRISAINGTGMEKLADLIEQAVWGHPHHNEPEFAISSRHAALLQEAAKTEKMLKDEIKNEQWELAAVNLRVVIAALGGITGEEISPDILDNIFSRFCIGK